MKRNLSDVIYSSPVIIYSNKYQLFPSMDQLSSGKSWWWSGCAGERWASWSGTSKIAARRVPAVTLVCQLRWINFVQTGTRNNESMEITATADDAGDSIVSGRGSNRSRICGSGSGFGSCSLRMTAGYCGFRRRKAKIQLEPGSHSSGIIRQSASSTQRAQRWSTTQQTCSDIIIDHRNQIVSLLLFLACSLSFLSVSDLV
jgi:hypothetical protein